MARRKIFDEQAVIDLYRSGKTIYEIADIYKMSGAGIFGLLKRNNVSCRDQRKTTDVDEEQLIAEYLDGGTLDSVSANWGIERTTVQHILIRHNIARHPCAIPTHKLNEHIFDNIDNEISAYLLGQVYADGCVMSNKGTLGICLAEKDHDYLDMLRTLYKTDFDIKIIAVKNYQNGNYSSACRLSLYSTHMASRLHDLGIVARRGEFNKTLESLHPSIYNHFVRGLYDGDGSIDWRVRNGKTTPVIRVRFLGQLDILTWLRDLLAVEINTNPDMKITQKAGIMGLDYAGGIVGFNIANWLYKDATIYMKRKHERYLEYKEIRGW